MKKIILVLSVLLFLSMPSAAQPRFGKAMLWNDNWNFKLATGQEAATPAYNTDFSRSRHVTLPHDWSVEGAYSRNNASATGFLPGGIGRYEKTFTLSGEQQSGEVYIYFEGIYNRSHVYLNGHLVGGRPNGYLPLLCRLTPYLNHDGENRLVVEADHSRFNDSRWYTGSGIYRDVYLVLASPIHTSLWGTSCIVETAKNLKSAKFNIATTLLNNSMQKGTAKVICTLYDRNNQEVGKSSKSIQLNSSDSIECRQSIRIKNPHLWSVHNPALYRLVTTLTVNGEETEQNEFYTGVRTIRFDADEGFFLNGENMKLKGVCLHHDAGCLGAAVPKVVWERRLRNLKSLGCNAIRMSHNPQASELYDLCDQLGFMVMDEAFDEWESPKRKWIEGWNKGTPGFDGNADFFDEWCETDLRDMVLRDRNHPSIILWSIGNEVDYPNDPYSHQVLDTGTINQPVHGGYQADKPHASHLSAISKRLVEVVKKYDTSRPVTAALAGVIMSNRTDYPFNVDVCGYNYTEDRYELDHKSYPERIIYGSENGHGIEAWKAVTEHPYISGQFLWTGIDYLGESRDDFSRGSLAGLLDYGGFIKPNGYFRRALWADEPVIYIGTYKNFTSRTGRRGNYLSPYAPALWNYTEGNNVRVVAYSNTPLSRLLLNGKEVGEPKPADTDSHIICWDIPFEAGTLTAQGTDQEGNILCSYNITTSGRPAALQATADHTTLQQGRGVCQIEVTVVDADGIPVILSDDQISCTTTGPLRLLGMENSDNNDMERRRGNSKRAVGGKLIVYVLATDRAGDATVTLTAPWLQKTEVRIKVE